MNRGRQADSQRQQQQTLTLIHPRHPSLSLSLSHSLFVVSLYSILLSKLLPLTGHPILDAIAQDDFYCVLIPAILPLATGLVIVNWFTFKLFRHN